jgi:hypothetical protein
MQLTELCLCTQDLTCTHGLMGCSHLGCGTEATIFRSSAASSLSELGEDVLFTDNADADGKSTWSGQAFGPPPQETQWNAYTLNANQDIELEAYGSNDISGETSSQMQLSNGLMLCTRPTANHAFCLEMELMAKVNALC